MESRLNKKKFKNLILTQTIKLFLNKYSRDKVFSKYGYFSKHDSYEIKV